MTATFLCSVHDHHRSDLASHTVLFSRALIILGRRRRRRNPRSSRPSRSLFISVDAFGLSPFRIETSTMIKVEQGEELNGCVFCNSNNNNHNNNKDIKYPCGTTFEKYFPECDENPNPDWYKGIVTRHYMDCQVLINDVKYEDGDTETMQNYEFENPKSVQNVVVKASVVKEEVMATTTMVKKEDEVEEDEDYVEEDNSDVDDEMEVEEVKSMKVAKKKKKIATSQKKPPHKKARTTNPSTTTTTTMDEVVSSGVAAAASREVVTPSPSACASNSNVAVAAVVPNSTTAASATAATSSTGRNAAQIKQEVLATANQDIIVKQEGSATMLAPAERQRRKTAFDYWLEMNTDPETKQGRYVFRRACHANCMSKVLGGSGMDPWPLVKKPPRLYDDKQINPFIKPGEFFVAGNEAWNPFGPR